MYEKDHFLHNTIKFIRNSITNTLFKDATIMIFLIQYSYVFEIY